MRIIIDEKVHQSIENFYRAAMNKHITLSFQTVEYNHRIYPKARLKQEWIDAGWQEFICEDFHFAYESGYDQFGEEVVYVYDAVHSLLYY